MLSDTSIVEVSTLERGGAVLQRLSGTHPCMRKEVFGHQQMSIWPIHAIESYNLTIFFCLSKTIGRWCTQDPFCHNNTKQLMITMASWVILRNLAWEEDSQRLKTSQYQAMSSSSVAIALASEEVFGHQQTSIWPFSRPGPRRYDPSSCSFLCKTRMQFRKQRWQSPVVDL